MTSAFRKDLARRLVVAVPAIVVLITLVHLGGWFFTGGLIVLGIAALGELGRLWPPARPGLPAAVAVLVGVLVAARVGGADAMLGAFAALAPLVFLLGLARGGAPAAGTVVSLAAVGWIGMGFGHGVLLREEEHGAGLVIAVLAGTFVGDTGAHIGGSFLGRTKLAPSVSPSKTVEGLLIGMAAAVLAVWVTGLFLDWLGQGEALLIGLAVALAAPLGDLFESSLKRDRGVKDSGGLFGAHGGALDRIDAVLFTAPAAYYMYLAVAGAAG